jgi:beta-glucanase (GH16 family)
MSIRVSRVGKCRLQVTSRAVEGACSSPADARTPVPLRILVQLCNPLPLIVLFSFSLLAIAQTRLDGQWVTFSRAGAPNSNLQCFTPNNVSLIAGNLVITTKLEAATCESIDLPSAGYKYTSGFVSMRTFNFLYGTVEFRAKFGGGTGTGAWPVAWMEDAACQPSDPTGTNDDCNGQEIDIAEILRGDFTRVNQQIHVSSFTHNDGCTASTTDTSKNFHVYQLVWSPGSLVFKIDGTTTCALTASYIPNAPMYFKFDMFVGSYGGPVNNRSLPWTTLVDYVKVTQGSTVVFDDDFNQSLASQFPRAVLTTPSSSSSSSQAPGAKVYLRWPFAGLACSVVVLAIFAFKLRSKTQRKKTTLT